MDKQQIEKQVIEKLKEVYDPEIPVNIYDLGLIYEVKISDEAEVSVKMTLTAPNCPVAETLPLEVRNAVKSIEAVKEVKVEIVLDPPWSTDMMSESARLDLDFLF